MFLFLMIRRPPGSTRTDTRFPSTTLFRSLGIGIPAQVTSNGKTYKAEVSAVSPEVVNGEVNARLRFAEGQQPPGLRQNRSEEHTSELQSLMRISSAVFCFKKKNTNPNPHTNNSTLPNLPPPHHSAS